MARVEINRCDVCGADDSPENRVSVRVSGIGNRPKPSRSPFELFVHFGGSEPEQPDAVDLCQRCGGGLIALLRERQAQRLREKPPMPKPSPAGLAYFNVGEAVIPPARLR